MKLDWIDGPWRERIIAVNLEGTRKIAGVSVTLDAGERLRITGVVGTRAVLRRGLAESCGQCVDEIAAIPADRLVGGLKAHDLARLVAMWRRWHLNDLRAGCKHQRAARWDERPIDPSKPLDSYGKHFEGQRSDSWNMLAWVRRDEHPEGLLCEPCPECGYRYGTTWLLEPLPDDVVAWANDWNDDKEPA